MKAPVRHTAWNPRAIVLYYWEWEDRGAKAAAAAAIVANVAIHKAMTAK